MPYGHAFLHPQQLLLWPVAVLLSVWWARRSKSLLPPLRMRVALALRLLTITLLVLALAGWAALWRQQRLTLVVAVDGSRSVGDSSHVVSALDSALEVGRQPNDQVGMVVFGARPMVEAYPSSQWQLGPLLSRPDDNGSDLAAALHVGGALVPANQEGRIILISDGLETKGSVATAVESLPPEVEVVWLPVQAAEAAEVLMDRVTAPERVRAGEPYRVHAVVKTSEQTNAELHLFRGAELVARSAVSLVPGRPNVFAFDEVAPASSGTLVYRATVAAALDGSRQNNRASALVRVDGSPSVLLVDPAPATLEHLASTLERGGLKVTLAGPSSLPGNMAEMTSFDGVVFSDVPATSFSPAQLGLLEGYTRDFGGGFLMLGGADSFGPGGYWQTPIERILPVDMEVKNRSHFPSLGILFCIDKSGSMAGMGEVAKIEVAKAAIGGVAELLMPSDRLGVVAFDAAAKWVVPLTQGGRPDSIKARLGTLRAGGGTDAYHALEMALAELQPVEVQVKHVILLTDGQLSSRDHEGIARRLRERRITLSTVAIGSDADLYTLERIAKAGGGRFYRAADIDRVPRIFLREAFKVARSWVVEETFEPKRRTQHAVLAGLPKAMPPLGGYVAASEKPAAEHPLVTPRGDPLLSLWRIGLGRSVAFTSDAKARWATPWLAWPGYEPFWTALVRWTLRTAGSDRIQIATDLVGQRLRLTADLLDARGGFVNGAELEARVVAPDGEVSVLSLEQVAPGRYEGSLEASRPGPYLVAVARDEEGVATAAASVPYSDELRFVGQSPAALERLVSSGRVRRVALSDVSEEPWWRRRDVGGRQERPLAPWLLVAAATLFVAEVAVRRLAFEEWLGGLSGSPKRSGVATAVREPPAPESSADAEPSRSSTTPSPVSSGATTSHPGSATESGASPSEAAGDVERRTSRLLAAKERARRRTAPRR